MMHTLPTAAEKRMYLEYIVGTSTATSIAKVIAILRSIININIMIIL